MINYNGRLFRPVETAESGEAGSETLFHYYQSGSVVWAEYSGGEVLRGHLIAVAAPDGSLDMRYHHINQSGDLKTGVCHSTPELLADGRLILNESWEWTSGDRSSGSSRLAEISPEPADAFSGNE